MGDNNLNVANVLLILVGLYFYYEYQLHIVGVLAFIFLAGITWAFHTGSNESKDLMKSQAELNRAKAENFRRLVKRGE